MIVFIDESGDAGFKLGLGSTPYFVVTAVIFDDELMAEQVAVNLKLLKRKLGLSDDYEFHFNGTKQAYKKEFLEVAMAGNFRVRAITFDKKLIKSAELRSNQASFYNYAVKKLLQDSKGKIENAKIKLDGHGDTVYKRAAGSYFRSELNSGNSKVVKSLKFVDSKENVLIQLADMVSGAIYRSLCAEKNDRILYITIIKKNIENIWPFK